MSAQAGIFYFDRRPVGPEIVSVMGTSLDSMTVRTAQESTFSPGSRWCIAHFMSHLKTCSRSSRLNLGAAM